MNRARSDRVIAMDTPMKGTETDSFRKTLSKHGLTMVRGRTETLQINLGLLCNQACRHCHLDAGPSRKEVMNAETAAHVTAFAEKNSFQAIDITGGAPELNKNLEYLIESLSPLTQRLIIRCNLTALDDGSHDHLFDLFPDYRVVVMASFPSLNLGQTDSQRGSGVFNKSINALKKLNAEGYGQADSGLELHLVSNPTGAFLPPSQNDSGKRFRQVLKERWGLVFNNLYNLANIPLGRFRDWLIQSGNYQTYMEKLLSCFNPCALEGVMCRNTLSVSWEGYLFDCDFNLAKGLYMGGQKTHVTELERPPEPGSAVVTANHCYTCTAGVGFT